MPVPSAAPGAQDAVATVEWVRSVARGRWVRLVLVAPPGVDRGTVPVCLGLHGLGGNAEWWADAGTRRTLGAARAGGAAPFLVAAVDGATTTGAPSGRVTIPGGCSSTSCPAGWAARRATPVRAAAVMSPGLFTEWRVASRRPFANEADWAANDPLRFHPELASTPTGVWVGDRDPFVVATRRYIALARPAVGSVSTGRHDGAFYSRVLPQVVRFLADHG